MGIVARKSHIEHRENIPRLTNGTRRQTRARTRHRYNNNNSSTQTGRRWLPPRKSHALRPQSLAPAKPPNPYDRVWHVKDDRDRDPPLGVDRVHVGGG